MTYEEKEYKQVRVVATTTAIVILMVISGAVFGPQACVGRNAALCSERCASGCHSVSSERFECQSAPVVNGKADLNVNLRSSP